MSRWIDAEKAIENTRNEVYWTESEAAAVRNFLNHQPTINPEDLRTRGRWIEVTDITLETYYDCSVCGESFCLIDGSPTDNLYRYCPNCGAKMNV